MALIGFEGFDALSSTPVNDLTQYMPFGSSGAYWYCITGSGYSLAKTAGLLGGYGITNANFSPNPRIVLASDLTRVIFGCRFHPHSTPISSIIDIVVFRDNASGIQCGLSILAAPYQTLIFWRGSHSNVIGTGTAKLLAGAWYFLEVDITISTTVGAVEVHIAGQTDINVTGVNTQATAIASLRQLYFLPEYNTDDILDDVYVCDTTGAAPYNTFLGVNRVETLYVTADNSVTWTPLSGSNYQMVDEVNMDSGTTYNSNTTTGIDTFAHGALSSTPTTIFSVDVVSAAAKTDVIAVNYRNKMISGSSTFSGTGSDLDTIYTYRRDSYLVDPNTSTAWTQAGVDATLIGYERY